TNGNGTADGATFYDQVAAGVPPIVPAPAPAGGPEAAPGGVLVGQAIEPVAVPDRHANGEADTWTAEDRALAVSGVLADIWAAGELRSPILSLDTAIAAGSGQVVVTIERHPDEEERIGELPELIVAQRPAWRAAWRRELLVVDVVTSGA